MSVTQRKWTYKAPDGTVTEGEAWQVFVRATMPDGREITHRRVLRGATKPEAVKEEARVRSAIRDGTYRDPKQIAASALTVLDWSKTFVEDRKANQKKASSIESIESILREHVIPVLGAKKLNALTDDDIRKFKLKIATKPNGKPAAPATMRNILTVLNAMMKLAIEEGKIKWAPRVKLPKVPVKEARFYEGDMYESFVTEAEKIDDRVLTLVLLGGEAGLRRGECVGLEWGDISFVRQTLAIRRSVVDGVEGTTKGNAERTVPMTARLASTLKRLKLQSGKDEGRVLRNDAGKELDRDDVKVWIKKVERRLGLPQSGRMHILRHTFCSRLASAGAQAKAIQELAGHTDIRVTARYMHLSPSDRTAAIHLLEAQPPAPPARPKQVLVQGMSRPQPVRPQVRAPLRESDLPVTGLRSSNQRTQGDTQRAPEPDDRRAPQRGQTNEGIPPTHSAEPPR